MRDPFIELAAPGRHLPHESVSSNRDGGLRGRVGWGSCVDRLHRVERRLRLGQLPLRRIGDSTRVVRHRERHADVGGRERLGQHLVPTPEGREGEDIVWHHLLQHSDLPCYVDVHL